MKHKCNKCGIEKELTIEYFRSTKQRGKLYLEKICRVCRATAAAIRAKERYHTDLIYKQAKLKSTQVSIDKNRLAKNETYLRRLEGNKRWKLENPDKVKIINNNRNKRRWANPHYKISKIMSNRINAFINDKDGKSWVECVNYTKTDLINHLEKQFRDGMTWDNHGAVWHIDHIKPISWFKFTSKDDEEFKECWSLTNLQPLLVSENLSKGNKYIG